MLNDAYISELIEKFSLLGVERCGVIQNGKVIELENTHNNPTDNFQFEASILETPNVTATWHTHPGGCSNLSCADYLTFSSLPDLVHYVIGTQGVWCFFVKDDMLILADDYNPLDRALSQACSKP